MNDKKTVEIPSFFMNKTLSETTSRTRRCCFFIASFHPLSSVFKRFDAVIHLAFSNGMNLIHPLTRDNEIRAVIRPHYRRREPNTSSVKSPVKLPHVKWAGKKKTSCVDVCLTEKITVCPRLIKVNTSLSSSIL